MGQVKPPRLVTPLVAMLSGDPAYFEKARPLLENLLGPVELVSPLYPFNRTEYYNAEMGPNIQRQFFTFKNLADPGNLVAWKLATNAMELDIAAASGPPLPREGEGLGVRGQPSVHSAIDESKIQNQKSKIIPRPVNLDVGYMTGAKLVLASTKDFAHRLYLRDGIFAEITMSFRGDSWVSHDFTFPDFRSGIYDDFLKKVRDWHLRKVKNL
ncbi:MAG TPA: DUF4416 family protein [Planctomycetota bacterium]|jgi:hypothetical protein